MVLAVFKSRYGLIQRSSVARLRKCSDLIREGEVFVKNKGLNIGSFKMFRIEIDV